MLRVVSIVITLALLTATSGGTAPVGRVTTPTASTASSPQEAAPATSDGTTSVAASAARRWRPKPGASFQIQYSGKLRATSASVIDLDGEETSAATVAKLKRLGKRVICYINAGAWENWRSDKAKFPARVRGKKLDGWPDERWLDVRKRSILVPIMTARMKTCKAKGFDAVDPDNMDGYQAKTGFAITRKAELAYLKALSRAAHRLGLSIGLKNGLSMIRSAQPMVDFAVNEQCLQYHECSAYRPFVRAKKAVFQIEYRGSIASICAHRPAGFSTVRKHLRLDAWVRHC